MIPKIVQTSRAVTLVGGGAAAAADLRDALALAPLAVAADGGASVLLRAGHPPAAVIGDMDSLNEKDRAQIPPQRLFEISEQDSTDFEKALSRIDAPLVIGVGFLGARLDHQLAALSVLTAQPGPRCLLIGAHEVALHLPARLAAETRAGDTVSLFPMRPVTGRSRGLHWPIDGLRLAPGGRVATSNRATGPVCIDTDGPGLIGLFPRARLGAIAAALRGT